MTADLDPPTVVGDLERTEDPILHPAPCSAAEWPAANCRRSTTELQPLCRTLRADGRPPRRVMTMIRIWSALAVVCRRRSSGGVRRRSEPSRARTGRSPSSATATAATSTSGRWTRTGGRLVNLTAKSKADDFAPNWRADGRRIAFMSNRVTATNPEGDFEIFVMKRRRVTPRQITFNALDDEDPAWSPDGRRIVFRQRLRSDRGSGRPRPLHDERRRHRPTQPHELAGRPGSVSRTGRRTAGGSPS